MCSSSHPIPNICAQEKWSTLECCPVDTFDESECVRPQLHRYRLKAQHDLSGQPQLIIMPVTEPNDANTVVPMARLKIRSHVQTMIASSKKLSLKSLNAEILWMVPVPTLNQLVTFYIICQF